METNYYSDNKNAIDVAADIKGSSPPFLAFVVATYFLANLIFLLVFFVNFPVLRDSLAFGKAATIFEIISENYMYPTFAAVAINFINTLVIYTNFVKRRFPSVLSFASLVYNDIMCLIFSIIIYMIDVRNIYFSMQITLLIPIITILLSSVFIIDDYYDLHRGKYISHTQHKKKGTLKVTEVPVATRTSTAEIAAANAAKLAIPDLNHISNDDQLTEADNSDNKTIIDNHLPTPEELALSDTAMLT